MGYLYDTEVLGTHYDLYSNLNAHQVAPEYSSSAPYAVGDYCVYDSVLYRCTTAITSGEAWTAGHWTAVKLGQDVTALKENLSDITGNDRLNNFIHDKYINTSGSTVDITDVLTSSSHYMYIIVDAEQNEEFTVTGTGGSSARLWCFIDSSGNVLSKSDANATANNKIISCSSNSTAKLIVQFNSAGGTFYRGKFLHKHVEELDTALTDITQGNEIFYKNLIGMEAYVRYPVNIPTGTTLTMSTADGEVLGQSNLLLMFYDENGNEISSGGWNFQQNASERTFTTNNGGKTAKFVAWNKIPAKNVQLEWGSSKTIYCPYYLPVKTAITLATNICAYFSYGALATWEKVRNTGYKLIFPTPVTTEDNLIVKYGIDTKSISVTDVLTAASEAGLTVSGRSVTGSIIILVFNLSTKQVEFVSSIRDNDVILFYSFYESGVWGLLCAEYFNVNRQMLDVYDYNLYGYISNGGGWEWNKSSYTCDLKIPPRNVLLKGTRIPDYISIPYTDIISALQASSLVTVSNGVVTGNSFSITYNVKTETVGVHANNNYDREEVILFAHHWNSGDWGIMAQDGGYDGINPTWLSHINQKVSAITENMDSVGKNGITFAFATDIHIENNDHYLHVLLSYIKKHTNLKYLITGGDYVTQREDKDLLMSEMRECINELKDSSRCFLPIVGNHDKNTNFSGETYQSYEMTDDEVYHCIHSLLPDKVVYGDYYYYYYDDEITKTRFILLGSGFEHYAGPCSLGSTQLAWAKTVMDNTPTGYHIFVFVHGIYQPDDWSTLTPVYDPDYLSSDGETLFDNVDSHNTSYPNTPVVAIFVGHIHLDMDTTTDGGVPVIWTDCDGRGTKSSEGYQVETIKSQCMDIVTVDYNSQNQTIKCLRIGRGSNRTFTY